MKSCAYCGRKNDDGALNCYECGTAFPQAEVEKAISILPSVFAEPPAHRTEPSAEPAVAVRNKCPYCGRQMDPQAAYCSGCGTALSSDESARTLPSSQGRTVSPAIGGLWSAREAWKCLGMLLVFEVVVGLVLAAAGELFRPFRHFLHTGYGHFSSGTLYGGIWVLTILYFARAETVSGFLKDFGLSVFATEYLWLVVVVALGFRLVGHALIIGGHLKGATNISLWGFAHTVGPERLFYLAPAVLAAFIEEICLRGFVYTAFRHAYSMLFSMALLVGLTLLTHYNQVLHSAVAFVLISGFTLFQCYLWERTGNLWTASSATLSSI